MLKPRLFANLSADAASAAAEDLFNDPVTFEEMNDPVVASDGFTYDRSFIEDWFRENNTSPTTGGELPTKRIDSEQLTQTSVAFNGRRLLCCFSRIVF